MGRGSTICERVRKNIVEYFKNKAPQRQIAMALQISSSTVHNIIKSFRETVEISVRKGQGQRPFLDARGLRALRHSGDPRLLGALRRTGGGVACVVEMKEFMQHICLCFTLISSAAPYAFDSFFFTFTFSHLADAFIQSDLQLGNT